MKLTLTSVAVGRVTPCAPSRDNSTSARSGLTRPTSARSAFTMVEIALCLAIIGFALVAIIGALPFGLNVQKENREETIIAQEANYFMEAIRNGARGLDELTNHVVSITNFWRDFDTTTEPWTPLPPPVAPDGYTATRSYVTSATVPNDAFPLTNGAYIVGLLSKPKLDGINNTTVRSNHVVAVVRAITGAASDKYPQTNVSVLDLGLTYRMVAEVHNVRLADSAGNNAQAVRANLHELRLKFSWPVFPGNKLGKGRQTFRTMAGGQILTAQPNGQPVFFFDPATY